MGTVNWFLGTQFEWSSHQDGALLCHLSQEAYAQNIVERYHLAKINFNPLATPYRSGCPINATPLAIIDEDDKFFVRRHKRTNPSAAASRSSPQIPAQTCPPQFCFLYPTVAVQTNSTSKLPST